MTEGNIFLNISGYHSDQYFSSVQHNSEHAFL
jgi:hypothetical protein